MCTNTRRGAPTWFLRLLPKRQSAATGQKIEDLALATAARFYSHGPGAVRSQSGTVRAARAHHRPALPSSCRAASTPSSSIRPSARAPRRPLQFSALSAAFRSKRTLGCWCKFSRISTKTRGKFHFSSSATAVTKPGCASDCRCGVHGSPAGRSALPRLRQHGSVCLPLAH